MGLDLNTALISDTFDGLIKTTDGNVLTATPTAITDGRGNNSSLGLATAGNGVTITGTLLVDGANIGSGLSAAQADILAIETKTDFITITGAVNLDTINTKVGFISVTQAVDLDTIESKLDFITISQAVNLDTVEANAAAAKTKTDFLTVTQPVNLDTLESDVNVAQLDITAIEAKTDNITVTQAVNLDTIESDLAASKAKTDFITVTQAVNLDTIESGLAQAQTDINLIEGKTNNITVTQAVNLDTMESDIAVNNAKNSYPAADATKVGFISITQPVNLDSIETDVANLSANKYDKTGGAISGSVTIGGDLTVNGTTTTINTETLSVEDPLIQLANQNSANTIDTGFFADYSLDAGVTTKYAGLFKDASDSDKFKLFKGLEVEPTTTVNTSGTGYAKGDLVIGDLNADSGTIGGTLSATTLGGTLSTAAQPNITSVGTLSSLAVSGDLNVDSGVLFVDVSTNRVGINTTTPSKSYLDIMGNNGVTVSASQGAFNDGYFATFASAFGNEGLQLKLNDHKVITTNGFNLPQSLIFSTYGGGASSERMRIDSSGRVGIGTSSPQGVLNIVRAASGATRSITAQELVLEHPFNVGMSLLGGDARIAFGDAAAPEAGLIQYVHASDYMAFRTANAEKMRIDSSGNVGIGTSSPTSKLFVSDTDCSIVAAASNTSGVAQLSLKPIGSDGSSVGDALIKGIPEGSDQATAMTFTLRQSGGTRTERMRITSGGEVQHTTGVVSYNGKRTVTRVVANGSGANIFPTSFGSSTPQVGHLYVTEIGTSNYLIAALFKQDSTTVVGVTYLANNNITASATNALGTIALTGFTNTNNVRMKAVIEEC